MKHWILIASAAMLAAGPATPAAAEANESKDDEIVCKVQTKENSRLPSRKDCRTRAEWALAKERFKTATEGAQRQSLLNTCIYSGSGKVC